MFSGGVWGRCSRSVLTCDQRLWVVGKTNMSLRILVADTGRLFRVPWLKPTGTAAPSPGKEPREVHVIRMPAHPSGGISDNRRVRVGGDPKTCMMDYSVERSWFPQEECEDVAVELEVSTALHSLWLLWPRAGYEDPCVDGCMFIPIPAIAEKDKCSSSDNLLDNNRGH